jgi:hypothetical protein
VSEKPLPRGVRIFWVFDPRHITVEDQNGQPISRNAYSIRLDDSPLSFTSKVEGEPDRVHLFELRDGWLRVTTKPGTGKRPTSLGDGETMRLKRIDTDGATRR